MSCLGNRCSCENKWDKLEYYGVGFTSLGEMPVGGSFPLNFFKKTSDGRFQTLDGKKVSFNIKSPDYFDDFMGEQLSEVSIASHNITPEQKIVADYWGNGIPHKQLIPILQTLITTYDLKVPVASRLYDIINKALNDATVICWHFKYYYQIPRPVQYLQDFTPYLATPQHPSYPAGHSVLPACFIKIASHFFPNEKEKLYTMLNECAWSRLYGGVHYPLDISEGIHLGEDIALKIIENLGVESDQSGATVDTIYTHYKDAPIAPNDYKQVLY